MPSISTVTAGTINRSGNCQVAPNLQPKTNIPSTGSSLFLPPVFSTLSVSSLEFDPSSFPSSGALRFPPFLRPRHPGL